MPVSEEAENKRLVAMKRAEQLKESIAAYRRALKEIPNGFGRWPQILKNQERIKAYFGATAAEWQDWHWHIKNRITTTAVLQELIPLSASEIEEINRTGSVCRWAVSPYYLSLIDPADPADPIRRQAIPCALECKDNYGIADPMDEEHSAPAAAISRRYPDRVVVMVTNQCAMYCRHCQRRRNIGEQDHATPRAQIEEALQYIRANEEIRDVLLTGGDAFMLENDQIAWLLEQLDRIPHVEIKRLGTRTPVTLPARVEDELCAILSRHLPLYVNTHFNHPLEVTPEAREACLKLARTGVALGNQAVLLRGVNNNPFIMRKLNQDLLKIMVRPYYIFHAKKVKGTSHFRTTVEEGLDIMEQLRGYTSGLAVPAFVVNAPGGLGKIPLLPQYLIGFGKDHVKIRTWENRILRYENKEAET